MDIKPIGPLLAGLPVPLEVPNLLALDAGNALYTVFALQPKGTLRVTPDSIGRANEADETAAFLRKSAELSPALTIAPEYSVSWQTLINCLRAGIRPQVGTAWILGCESLRLDAIASISEMLVGHAVVIHEQLNLQSKTTQQYVNPLAYVFETLRRDGQGSELVLVIQFKTAPSGDAENTEPTGMLPGKDIYLFGADNEEKRIKLITLICSDTFAIGDERIGKYADELLLIHLQLNNKPYDAQYAAYRTTLFGRDTRTELICLNWATGTNYVGSVGGKPKELVSYTGSAWYRRAKPSHLTDERIKANDVKGLYFTHDRELRVSALQFTQNQCALLIASTKVFHHLVPAAASNLTGPEVTRAYVWSHEESLWNEVDSIDDGFPEIIRTSMPWLNDLGPAHEEGAINVDRIAAITNGNIGGDHWYTPIELESLQLGNAEMVRRLTLGIDPRSEGFRESSLSPIRLLAQLRSEGFKWPSEVDFLNGGFDIQWNNRQPHRNVAALADEKRKYATITLSTSSTPSYLDKLDRKIRRVVGGTPPRADEDLTEDEQSARNDEHYLTPRKVCLIYQNGTTFVPFLNSFTTDISRPSTVSDVSFSDASFHSPSQDQ